MEAEETTETLWRVAISGLVKATSEEEAQKKAEKGWLIVDDVIGAEPEPLAHLTGDPREKMIKRIFEALTFVEKSPSPEW